MKVILLASLIITNVVARDTECYTSDDCEIDECCTTTYSSYFYNGPGTCTRLGQDGDSCALFKASTRSGSKTYYQSCPCDQGYECIATVRWNAYSYGINLLPYCVSSGDYDSGYEPYERYSENGSLVNASVPYTSENANASDVYNNERTTSREISSNETATTSEIPRDENATTSDMSSNENATRTRNDIWSNEIATTSDMPSNENATRTRNDIWSNENATTSDISSNENATNAPIISRTSSPENMGSDWTTESGGTEPIQNQTVTWGH